MAAQIPSGTIKALGIAPRPGFSQLVASARSNLSIPQGSSPYNSGFVD